MKIFTQPFKSARLYSGKGNWYVYYHYKNPLTGKWQMFKDRAGLNYKELKENTKARRLSGQEIADAYNERLRAGWSPFKQADQPEPEFDDLKYMPVCKALYKLLEIKKSSIKKRSGDGYKYSIAAFEKWLIENNLDNLSVEFFTEKNARAYMDSLMIAGKLRNKSINQHITNIKIAFNMVIDRELIAKNPFRKIKPLQVEVGKNFAFSEAQKKELKKEILKSHPELWPFVKCVYHLFIRPIEILQLRVADVDLRTNQVIVHSDRGKNKKQLPVEIPESFLPMVKMWKLEQYPADWYLFGQGYKPGPKRMKRNTVSRHHASILDSCKLDKKKYSLYGWKHTGNVDSYLAGIDIYDLMRQNRHHSLEQTMGYLRSLGLRPNVNFGKKAPAL